MVQSFFPYIHIILDALWVTIALSIAGFSLGFGIGALLLFLRTFSNRVVARAIDGFIDVIRGIPLLVMLFLIFYGFPALGFQIPNMLAAALGMGILSGAYQSQIFRSLLHSVSSSQYESSLAIGLSRWESFRYVIFPQVLRLSIPALINEYTILLKDTSVAYAIGVTEMFTQSVHVSQVIMSFTYPLLFVSAIYLTICFSLSSLANHLYRKLSYGYSIREHIGG
ncbi:MAG: amino acid ABC transporter permease [Fervidicoccaceae archaeon]|jgi:polar amino acid transport system permease protein